MPEVADLADAHARLDRCGADAELLALCRRCLSPSSADRPANGQAVADELTAYLNGVQEWLHQVELATAEARARTEEEAKRRRLALALAGAVLLVLLAGVIVSGWFAIKAGEEADKASRQAVAARNAEKIAKDRAEAEAEARKLAAASEAAARAAEEAGRKLLYTTDMQLAPFLWADDRTTAQKLRTLLAKHVPESPVKGNTSALLTELKPDLRGFEWYYYQHLLAESAAVFRGHAVSVVDAAFTSKGQLVTLDQNGQVRHWNLDSQHEDEARRRALLKAPSGGPQVLSPDGRLAALAEGNQVHVFDTSSGKEHFQTDSTDAWRLMFTPDSSRLVIVDGSKIQWCSATTGHVIASLDQHFNAVASLAVSADGLTLAVVGHGPTGNQFSIFRLDAATGRLVPQAKDVAPYTTPSLSSAGLSSDGRLLAVGTVYSGAVVVCDTVTGRPIAQHGSAHASNIAAVTFSGDGAMLATADSEGTIKIWEDARKLTSNSAALITLKGHEGGDHASWFFARRQATRQHQRRQDGQGVGPGTLRRRHPWPGTARHSLLCGAVLTRWAPDRRRRRTERAAVGCCHGETRARIVRRPEGPSL